MTTTPRPLGTITLSAGAHPSPNDGMCLLEAAAYVAGEPFSDHPSCVSPVLGAFGRGLNDALPDDERQSLVALIPLLIGTRGDGHDERRSYMALDWLIRTYLPAFLDLSTPGEASKVRALAPITDTEAAVAAGPVVRSARDAAWAAAGDAARDAARDAAGDAAWAAARAAAWAAARDAAGDAAGDAAWDAAWDAARDAARAAAWAAARAAAWAAARDAAWDVAWDVARDVAGDAAGDAARAAAWAAARDAAGDAAGDAARAAAREALAPTVKALQDSAIRLFSEMIAPEGME